MAPRGAFEKILSLEQGRVVRPVRRGSAAFLSSLILIIGRIGNLCRSGRQTLPIWIGSICCC
jgi:hypothetical protein